MTQIDEALVDSNPWWKGDFEIEYKEREIYNQLAKFRKMPQILALTGLRRVGKTTLMLKMVEEELKMGFEPKNIIYRYLSGNGVNRNTKFLTDREANDEDATEDEFLTECGLEVQHEATHGILKNVNSYTTT